MERTCLLLTLAALLGTLTSLDVPGRRLGLAIDGSAAGPRTALMVERVLAEVRPRDSVVVVTTGRALFRGLQARGAHTSVEHLPDATLVQATRRVASRLGAAPEGGRRTLLGVLGGNGELPADALAGLPAETRVRVAGVHVAAGTAALLAQKPWRQDVRQAASFDEAAAAELAREIGGPRRPQPTPRTGAWLALAAASWAALEAKRARERRRRMLILLMDGSLIDVRHGARVTLGEVQLHRSGNRLYDPENRRWFTREALASVADLPVLAVSDRLPGGCMDGSDALAPAAGVGGQRA